MKLISLTPLDLSIAAALVLALAGLSVRMQLAVERQLLIAALRTTVQTSAKEFWQVSPRLIDQPG